jgi:glyoxylate/hydroxypyruvate reductase
MDKIHVLVTVPLQETDIRKIEAIDPRIAVTYAMEEVRCERGLPRNAIAALINSARQQDIPAAEASRLLDEMLSLTQVIFTWRLPLNVLNRAPHLEWVQISAVGVDLILGGSGLLESDVQITTASGINTTNVAEATIGFIFMLAKKAITLLKNKNLRRWEPQVFSLITGKTLGIIGLGRIGSEVARLAKLMGMRVMSTTKVEDNTSGVDKVYPPEELCSMLPECDYVVVTAPLTAETKGLIGERELKSMKPKAYLINVSRGSIIKQEVLIQALKEGWIAGAALDVFETEPLPANSEIWAMDNVIVSPHSAGVVEHHTSAATDIFCENLKRYLAGKDLLNVFNKNRGY